MIDEQAKAGAVVKCTWADEDSLPERERERNLKFRF